MFVMLVRGLWNDHSAHNMVKGFPMIPKAQEGAYGLLGLRCDHKQNKTNTS
jgi:hypothetical protein